MCTQLSAIIGLPERQRTSSWKAYLYKSIHSVCAINGVSFDDIPEVILGTESEELEIVATTGQQPRRPNGRYAARSDWDEEYALRRS